MLRKALLTLQGYDRQEMAISIGESRRILASKKDGFAATVRICGTCGMRAGSLSQTGLLPTQPSVRPPARAHGQIIQVPPMEFYKFEELSFYLGIRFSMGLVSFAEL